MNKKLVLIIIPILLLANIAIIMSTFAQPTIKIAIIGPQGLPHWSPAGMKEAAEIARDEINAAGGINVSNTFYDVELLFGNEYSYPTIDPVSAAGEVAYLLTQGAQYFIGGFRTECTAAMIEVAMDVPVPWLINGASTDFLINATVRDDYPRYKYLFRNNPVNSTTLFNTIGGYLGGYLIPAKLVKMYGSPVKVSVITENLAWTDAMHAALTNPMIYPYILGPNATVVHDARLYNAAPATLQATMLDVIASGARLMIHVFSGLDGAGLIVTHNAMSVNALPVGINVLAQLQTFWGDTGGACEYECILNFVGTDTPVTPEASIFWDNFTTKTGGVWPMYTAYGCYDSIYGLKEALEAAGTLDYDALVAQLETTDRQALTGKFKYTQGFNGHDVYSATVGPTWPDGYTRAFIVQWVEKLGSGVMEVVNPTDQLYSRKTQIPPWYYPSGYEALAVADINFDGTIDIFDIVVVALSFGSVPGDGNWNIEADLNIDGIIDIFDIVLIATEYGLTAPTWPLP
jgi:branched-chain amino acid transport system substrate-binding protein